MKLSAIVLLVFSISLGYEVNANDLSISLRGSMENNRRALRVKHPCILVRVETQFEDELEENYGSRDRIYNDSGNSGARKLHGGERKIRCELQDEDRAAVGKSFVSVNGIEASQIENIESGDTTLISDDAMIMDGEMWLSADAAIEFGSNRQNNRRLLQTSRTHGVKKVLVVRADAQGSATTPTRETLSNKIFGTHGDSNTLRSQYFACSQGKVVFQPFEGMTTGGTVIQNGVLDVTIDITAPGTSRYDIEDALEKAADQLVGSLHDQFDHVMLCLPPGTTSGSNRNWVAYGYVNSWLSVFNDGFCNSMSTQVHEIGHNLGLAHSGKDGISYGDKSGMMGYSYNRDNGPMQCFNPAKTYQLGWFDDKVLEIDPTRGTWVGTIIGATDYMNSNVNQNANVVVKIKTGEFNDLFVGYNRQKDMNAGVPDGGDKITIVEQGQGYSHSDFLASLSIEASTKTFYQFGGTDKNLVVDFIGQGSNIDEAIVAIYYDTCVYPSCCEGSMCEGLAPPDLSIVTPIQVERPILTAAPTAMPTPAPIQKRTPAPTDRPRLYNYRSVSLQKRILSENFRNGLGVFHGEGNEVQQNMFQYVLTAKFELKEAGNLPTMSTTIDLQGTSFIEVTFWYNAEKMQNEEGFKLQYSSDHGNSWADIRTFKFGEGGFDKTEKWNHANKVSFEVARGVQDTDLRFVGDTTTDDSDSVFYIAGINVDGTSNL